MQDMNLSDIPALYRDPPVDVANPAQTLPLAIQSAGINLNAVLYSAAGIGRHPVILLLHGLPGNEQNLDLAQTARRAGWNVLTIHYRGSWGGPGIFRFEHCLQDAAAALNWIHEAAREHGSKLDPDRIVVVGHSMGGFIAAHVAAGRSDVRGAALISGVDIGQSFGSLENGSQIEARIDENIGISAGLHILAGTTPQALAQEARQNASQWRLTNYADRLSAKPMLLITSNDGFAAGSNALADALRRADASRLYLAHLATDHSYSGCRIKLQTTVLGWLAATCLHQQAKF